MADYLLTAPNAAIMLYALTSTGLAAAGGYTFNGQLSDGGFWQLVIRGLVTPPLHQVTAQPANANDFTDNVGLPSQPEVAMVQNGNVGIETPVMGTPVFKAVVHWNSANPPPNWAAYGVTVANI